jgi:K+-sensing histidine kinase KdpD
MGIKTLVPPSAERVDGAMERTPSHSVLLTVAVAAPAAVCAVLAAFRDVLPNDNAALVLVLLVVAVAAAGHRPSAIVAALSSAVWFDFFLTKPYYTFTINSRDDVETAVLLVLVGLAVTEIALWGRRQQGRASRGAGYMEGVTDAARMAAEGDTPPAAVVSFVADQITHVLGVDQCVFKPANPAAHPRINRDGSVTRDGRPIDVDRSGLPSHDVTDIVVESQGRTLGHFETLSASRVVWPTREQRRVAVTLADQAGAALAAAPARD